MTQWMLSFGLILSVMYFLTQYSQIKQNPSSLLPYIIKNYINHNSMRNFVVKSQSSQMTTKPYSVPKPLYLFHPLYYYYSQIIMKHLPIESILAKRKLSRQPSRHQPQHQPDPILPSQQPLDQSHINAITGPAKQGVPLTNEAKLTILEIINKKCNIKLNKNIVLPHMSVIHCKILQDLTHSYFQKNESFFILQGQINIYQQGQQNQLNFNTQPIPKTPSYNPQQLFQFSFEDFQKHNITLKATQQYLIYSGIGSIFGTKIQKLPKTRIVAKQAILINFKHIENDEFLFSDGLLFEQKLELINYFPVLKLVGKKLMSFVNNFKIKNFNFKDIIYKKGDLPQSVYFIIEGNVSFELLLNQKDSEKNNQNSTSSINICTISSKNYFGQEQIFFKKTTRSHTAKVISSNCVTLQLSRDKFEKLCQNSEFNDLIMKTTKLKQFERLQKYEKMKKLLRAKKEQQSGGQASLSKHELEQHTQGIRNENKRRFSSFRGSSQKVKLMHGNLIRQVPLSKQKVNFSMLKVNPDHFQATKDKYRQYFVQKPENIQPDPWSFKKLWKLLNLQEILSENEIDISNNDGKKFFQTHRRLKNQMLESKSVRPKTTSSTYRTKIQYIAYLQQFNQ